MSNQAKPAVPERIIEPIARRATPFLAAMTLAALALTTLTADAQPGGGGPEYTAARFATFNIEDLRTAELTGQPSDRILRAARAIQRLRANVLLINEVTYDQPGDPGFTPGDEPGRNGGRLADLLAATLPAGLGEGVEPVDYRAVMLPVNTGIPSGFDLDRNGIAVSDVPPQLSLGADGTPPPQTASGRAYGNDAWGFGTFPGQYGMALLVDQRLEVLEDRIRTFREFRWIDMPDHLMPVVPDRADPTPDPWYAGDAGRMYRLSSKSHWDVPVRTPDGQVVHVLASHPTPPAFDGQEQRNVLRNHDEIRFWADYISGEGYIVDDSGRRGGLPEDAHFVIMGDLNADPEEGGSREGSIESLLNHPRVLPTEAPRSNVPVPELEPTDTAMFGLRVDYVLPSAGLRVLRSGVWRFGAETDDFPSDHFPVWADLAVPRPADD